MQEKYGKGEGARRERKLMKKARKIERQNTEKASKINKGGKDGRGKLEWKIINERNARKRT
jgi:hypothetical protein